VELGICYKDVFGRFDYFCSWFLHHIEKNLSLEVDKARG